MKTIADLKPREKATIKTVQTGSDWVHRLMVMGLVEGAEVEYIGSAMGGDPIEITLYGSSMSIQKESAELFEI